MWRSIKSGIDGMKKDLLFLVGSDILCKEGVEIANYKAACSNKRRWFITKHVAKLHCARSVVDAKGFCRKHRDKQ